MIKVPERDQGRDSNMITFVIVLAKMTNLHGDAPVGHRVRWTYKHLPSHIAIQKAFAALVRDLPTESRLDWKVVDDGA